MCCINNLLQPHILFWILHRKGASYSYSLNWWRWMPKIIWIPHTHSLVKFQIHKVSAITGNCMYKLTVVVSLIINNWRIMFQIIKWIVCVYVYPNWRLIWVLKQGFINNKLSIFYILMKTHMLFNFKEFTYLMNRINEFKLSFRDCVYTLWNHNNRDHNGQVHIVYLSFTCIHFALMLLTMWYESKRAFAIKFHFIHFHLPTHVQLANANGKCTFRKFVFNKDVCLALNIKNICES